MADLDQDDKLLERVSSAVATKPTPQDVAGRGESPAARSKWNLGGIYGGTRVSTSFGEVPAHLVRVRDQLRTRDGNFARVMRIDEYKLDDEFLVRHPEARPIRFQPKKTNGRPSGAPVYLSPGQVVLARNATGTETLRPASEFLNQPGVMPEATGPFSYFIFHLGQAALVRAEGMWIAMGS